MTTMTTETTTRTEKSQSIKWAPFSKKHRRFIKRALVNEMSVAEGAIRSGKTIDLCIIAQAIIDTTDDVYHLVSGSTMANAKLNVGVCNGFGLENLFRGRCKWGKYKSNEALYIEDVKGREKVVIFAGGGKADSYKSILGNSYGLWLATEVNEHYDSDDSRTSFIKVAMGRQLAANNPVTLWDLNPCYPEHKIYTEYIDKWQASGLPGGYQYQLFTIHDNLSLSKKRIEAIESKYDKNSVWYRRDILGQRVRAEGLCYPAFANGHIALKIDSKDARYDYIDLGMDIGGNKSFHTVVATGKTRDGRKFTGLASTRIKATGTTANDVIREFEKFLDFVHGKYGRVNTLFFESAEQVLKNSLAAALPWLNIRNSIKNEIMDRVRAGDILTDPANGMFEYTEDCDTLVGALTAAVFNPKQLHDERLDDGSSDVDTLDAWEYSWEDQIRQIIQTK